MPVAIKVENISKAYQLGELGTGTISRDIERWWALLRGKEDPYLKIGSENDRTISGNKNEVVWSINSSLNYLRGGADAIPFLNHPECENIYYFPNNYINKFI